MPQTIKCVVVGNKGIGKTRLLESFEKLYSNSFGDRSPPMDCKSNYDKFVVIKMNINGTDIELQLWDTSGIPRNTRKLIYKDTNIFLICFSVGAPDSFRKAKIKWAREIKRYDRKVPSILVGLQTDLRFHEDTVEKLMNRRRTPIKYEQGEKVAKQIDAETYLECSAYTQFNIKTIFDETVRIALKNPREKTDVNCNIL